MEQIRLIIGLGNPGLEYSKTRHNVGFMFLDFLAGDFLEEKKFKALISKYNNILLAKPLTYMNSSGDSVNAIANFYKIPSSQILIIHDDLDIRLGEYKLQFNKGPKVHNGILSIEQKLASTEFWRLRVGIDSRNEEQKKYMSGSDYVLGRFVEQENNLIESVFTEIKEALFD